MANILILSIEKRSKDAVKVQQILTKAGCMIKTRLGIHEASENSCSDAGIIILELVGAPKEIKDLISKFADVKSVKTKFVRI
ncbi:MAG: hypothetical protein LBQ47_09080 [Endomicrobium sp.]|jgi:hypothetical protein|nr:hypothetical protein [Endomicrobium sp.]